MAYTGPERRHYVVMVTRNTEYHLRDSLCVAVRDRRSGQWSLRHRAVGSRLVATFTLTEQGSWKVVRESVPRLGEKLCFSADVMTSAVVEIRRPSSDTVRKYVALRLGASHGL